MTTTVRARFGRIGAVASAVTLAMVMVIGLAGPAAAHTTRVDRSGQSVNVIYTRYDGHTGCTFQYRFGQFGVPYAQVRTSISGGGPRCRGITAWVVARDRSGGIRTYVEDRINWQTGWRQAQAPAGMSIIGIHVKAHGAGGHLTNFRATWLP